MKLGGAVMEFDRSTGTYYKVPVEKEILDEMTDLITRLRTLNTKERQVWDKLSNLDIVDKGFNDFYD